MPLGGKKQAKGGDKREKLNQELFQFQKCVESGFPSKCSAIAYDDRLKLLAVGTKTGQVKIYGQPGVEFSGRHADELEIQKLLFVPEQGRLIAFGADSTAHLWELNFEANSGQGVLEEIRSVSLVDADSQPIGSSAYCFSHDAQVLFIGTESSLIYVLRVVDLALVEAPLRPDILLAGLPKKYQASPGSVEGLALNPQNGSQLLIAYAHGLVVSYTVGEFGVQRQVDAAYHCDGISIQSLSVHRDGMRFVTAHEDGSYVWWHLHPEESSSDEESADDNELTPVRVMKLKKKPSVVYGPAACKPITKMTVKSSEKGDMLVLQGGMPRAAHGEKFTVSVIRGEQHATFDLTSKVLDFVVVNSDELLMQFDNPDILLLLAEEELVAIDLQSEPWQQTLTPYMATIHSSAITCSTHFANVDQRFFSRMRLLGETQMRRFNQSVRGWPVNGGRLLPQEIQYCARDVFVTGHESGAVNFWDASCSGSISWLCKLSTAKLFKGEFADAVDGFVDEAAVPGEPPFRKAGLYDPYSDDPRLAVQKVVIGGEQQAVAVGGAAGQVIVFRLADEDRENVLPISNREFIKCDIVKANEKFVWKGWEALPIRDSAVNLPSGFQPVALMELNPPAAIGAMDFSATWNVLVVGTAHGYAVVDVTARKVIMTRCTLDLANELARQAAQAGPIQRMRSSLKKSLRQSFRRVRRARESMRRSMRKKNTATDKKGNKLAQAAGREKVLRNSEAVEPKPVERAIEAHVDQKEINTGLVRTVLLADTFITSSHQRVPAVIVATTGGVALLHTLTLPVDRRSAEARCELSKELQLQHKAAIVHVAVLRDPDMAPVGAPDLTPAGSRGPELHHLVVFSEEQIKVFSLPYLKPKCKAKLTAVDGHLIRKVAVAQFRTRHGAQDDVTEHAAVLLTNQGDLRVYHLDVRVIRCELQLQDCIRQQDAVGINSCVLTRNAHAYYHSSPSEFMRFSVSARNQQTPLCSVPLTESGRVVKRLGKLATTPLASVSGGVTLTPIAHKQLPPSPRVSPQVHDQLSPKTKTKAKTTLSQSAKPMQVSPVTSTPISPPKSAVEDHNAVYYSMPPPAHDNNAVYYSMPPAADSTAVYYSLPPDLPPKNRFSASTKPVPPKPQDDDDDEQSEESESEGEATLQSPSKPVFSNSLQLGSNLSGSAAKNGAHGDDDDEDEDDV